VGKGAQVTQNPYHFKRLHQVERFQSDVVQTVKAKEKILNQVCFRRMFYEILNFNRLQGVGLFEQNSENSGNALFDP